MKEIIKNWIENEATDEEVNELVAELNSWDGSFSELRYYDMEDLNDLFYGVKPTELLEKLDDGFDVSDDGFLDNGWKLKSCSFDDAIADMRANAEEIAEHVEEEMENITLPDGLKNYLEEIDLEDQE